METHTHTKFRNYFTFAIITLLLIFTSCAYFNTFYNANLFFDEAEQIDRLSDFFLNANGFNRGLDNIDSYIRSGFNKDNVSCLSH